MTHTDPPGAIRFALDEDAVIIPLQKQCCLVLSVQQYLAGIRRGRWWRRRQAMLAREQARQDALEPTNGEHPIPG